VLAGRVQDAEGRPLPEAEILARPDSPGPSGARPRWISARMDPEGRFQLRGLEPGEYRVRCSAPGMIRQERTAPAGARDVVLRMRPAPRITGRVRLVPGDEPAPSFQIALRRSWKLHPSTFRFLDERGRFTLPGVEEGDYELEATVDRDDERFTGRTTFHMTAEASPPFQDVRVERTRSLRGLVQDPDGFPVPDARIAMVLDGRSLEDPLYSTETDRTGRYTVHQVAPGAYEVRASHPDWIETSTRILVGPGALASLDFVLERTGGSLRVSVVDERNRPVPGARIHVVRPEGTFLHPDRAKYERAYLARKRSNPDLRYETWIETYTRTDASGVLVRQFLPSGSYEVRAEAEGFEAGTSKVVIRAGAESGVRIEVRRSSGG